VATGPPVTTVCGGGRGRIPVTKVVADHTEVTTLMTVFKGTDQNKETRSNDVNTMDIAKSGGDESELSSSPPMTRSLIPTTMSMPNMMKKETMKNTMNKEKKTRKEKKMRKPKMKKCPAIMGS
jgi:hypothetical protein